MAFLQTDYINPRVTNVLLPLQNNMKYNRDYKYVLVSKSNEINSFIEKKEFELSENVVNEVIKELKKYVFIEQKYFKQLYKN